MLYFYLVLAAVIIPISDRFWGILHNPNSWWTTPLIFLGIFLLLLILHFAFVVISVSLIRLDSNPDKFSKYIRKIISVTLPMFFRLAGVKIETEGVEKIPENTRFLLVSNHRDNFDPVVILSVLPDKELAFVGKKEIYEQMPIVAKAMHKLHSLPIDRENNREAVKAIIGAVRLIKEDKVSFGIFPEGYTSKTGEILPMRNGAFKIAYKAEVPVVVCTLTGTEKIIKNMFRRKTTVYFDVLRVFPFEELKEMSTTKLGEEVSRIMKESTAKRKANKD